MLKNIPLILATTNPGKITEMRNLLSGFSINLKSLDQLGPLPPFEEDGKTFEDNAYKKAFETASAAGFPALADDSGLLVEALSGAPGVFSARYAGPQATDTENNAKLLREMENVDNRKAAFECIIAIAVPSGPALIYEGRVEGEILREPRGDKGFGYDPLFYYPPLGKTFAELSIEEKNSVSHRGKALNELKDEFDKVLIWIRQRLQEAGWQFE